MSNEQKAPRDQIEEAYAKLHKGLLAIFLLCALIVPIAFLAHSKEQPGLELLKKAQTHIKNGEGFHALPFLKKAASLNDSSLDLVLDVYQRCRMFKDKAETSYLQRIKDRDEQLGNLLEELAAYDDKGPRAFDKVFDRARKVLALRPQYAQAHSLLAAHYLRDKKLEKAKAHIEQGLTSYPDSPALHCELAMLEILTNPSSTKVSEHFLRALRSHPNYRPALGGYLRYCTDRGLHDEIIDFLKKRRNKNPQDFQTIVNLALALNNSGKEQEGLQLLREELAKSKGSTLLACRRKRYLRPRLFHLHMKKDRWKEALELANEVIADVTEPPKDTIIAKERIMESLACLSYIKAEQDKCPRGQYSSLMTRSLKLDKGQRALRTFVVKNEKK